MHWEDWERLIACAPQAISLFAGPAPQGGPARPSALSGGTRPASERPLASPSNFQICAQSSSGQGYASPGKGPFPTLRIPFRRWPRASIGLCLGCAKADKANKGPAFRNEMRAYRLYSSPFEKVQPAIQPLPSFRGRCLSKRFSIAGAIGITWRRCQRTPLHKHSLLRRCCSRFPWLRSPLPGRSAYLQSRPHRFCRPCRCSRC